MKTIEQVAGCPKRSGTPFAVADITSSLEKLHHKDGWENEDCGGVTLLKTEGLTLALVVMRAGARISETNTDGTLTIQVLEGEIELTIEETAVTLHMGQIVLIDDEVTHNILATEETVLLLTNHVCL